MDSVYYVFIVIFLIIIISSLCLFTYIFLLKTLKSKGKTRIKGNLKILKFLEINFEAERDNSTEK